MYTNPSHWTQLDCNGIYEMKLELDWMFFSMGNQLDDIMWDTWRCLVDSTVEPIPALTQFNQ